MDAEATSVGRIARGAARSAVALLSAAVLATTGYAWTVTADLSDRVATSDAVPAAAATVAPPVEAAFTALLVGLDSRTDTFGEPLPPAVLAELHAGGDDGQLNTDTIILLHVPGGPHPKAVAISFPRDSYVDIAGKHGTHKINSAYRRGLADAEAAIRDRDLLPAERERRGREAGRRSLVATVQELSGITVDHFAEINLAGFVEITDALGGVPVCLNAAVQESRSGIDLPAGEQLIRGPEALAFVRQRHGLDSGDIDRIGRQQAFLAGLTNSVLSTSTLRDPVRLERIARAAGRYVVLDRGWNVGELVGQLRRVAAGDLRFVTIPTGTPALQTPGDGVAVQVDPDEVRQFVRTQLPGVPRRPGATPSRGPGAVGASPMSTVPGSPAVTPSTPPAGPSMASVEPGASLVADPSTAPSEPSASLVADPSTAPSEPSRPTAGPRTSPAAGSTAARGASSPTASATGAARPPGRSSPPTTTTTTASSTPPSAPSAAHSADATTTAPPITADGVPCVD